jgi:hypothetical protein
MTEFDFDVITGPSGPMRRGSSACGWTPAEDPEAPPVAPPLAVPERDRQRDARSDA